MFSKVLNKFFTEGFEYENNKGTKTQEVPMLDEIKATVERSSDTLMEDAFGVASLFALLIAGLCLPSLF